MSSGYYLGFMTPGDVCSMSYSESIWQMLDAWMSRQ